MSDDPCERLAAIVAEAGMTFAVGLRQQGHLQTVEKMLSEGKSWEEIGRAIRWDARAAEEWYEFERKDKTP